MYHSKTFAHTEGRFLFAVAGNQFQYMQDMQDCWSFRLQYIQKRICRITASLEPLAIVEIRPA